MRRGFVLIIAVGCVVGAGAAAGPALGSGLQGTVVRREASLRSFVIATRSGRLVRIHARRSPGVGRVVRVAGHRVRSGDYQARKVRVAGRIWHARVRGTVAWVNAARTVLRIARRGASVVVRIRPSSPASARPSRGAGVDLRVWINKYGRLVAASQRKNVKPVQQIGTRPGGSTSSQAPDAADNAVGETVTSDPSDPDPSYTIDATIDRVDQQSRTLSVSPVEDDEYGAHATILVPRSFNLSDFVVGDEAEFVVDQQGSGPYVLQSVDGLDDASADAPDSGTDNTP